MHCYVHLAGAKTPTGLIFYKCVFPGWVHGDGGRLLAPWVTANLGSGETGMTNAPSDAQTDSILSPSEAELTLVP